jgi:hypothetical protein
LPFAGFVLAADFDTTGFGLAFGFISGSSSSLLGGEDNASSDSNSTSDFLDRFLARPPSSGEVRFRGLDVFEGLTGLERVATLVGLVMGRTVGEVGTPACRFPWKAKDQQTCQL